MKNFHAELIRYIRKGQRKKDRISARIAFAALLSNTSDTGKRATSTDVVANVTENRNYNTTQHNESLLQSSTFALETYISPVATHASLKPSHNHNTTTKRFCIYCYFSSVSCVRASYILLVYNQKKTARANFVTVLYSGVTDNDSSLLCNLLNEGMLWWIKSVHMRATTRCPMTGGIFRK